MLKEERLAKILDRLTTDQKVLLSTLSEELNVSEHTIRRDIRELSDQNLLKAVRGGAVPHSPTPYHFRDRMQRGAEYKKIIAEKALTFLEDGQDVIFDGGTSTLAIAEVLPKDLRITVLTNSFPVASVLEDHPNTEVIFAGGRLYKPSFVTLGSTVNRFFENFHADLCFLGICSIHPELGITTVYHEECEAKAAMIRGASQVVAVSAMEKIGTVETYSIGETKSLHALVTELSPEDALLHPYHHLGIQVL
ncbi:MAG: DeoR/GlpR transcriptional regulator [Mucilaginibacter polytrichastri]|nr:DeoR/GlpR transcriptional regulator [Mucilaginibacter polytrichastri]